MELIPQPAYDLILYILLLGTAKYFLAHPLLGSSGNLHSHVLISLDRNATPQNRGTWPPWNLYSKVVKLLGDLGLVSTSVSHGREYITTTRAMKYINLHHMGKSSPIRFATTDACQYVWGYLYTYKSPLHILVFVKVPAGGMEARDVKLI